MSLLAKKAEIKAHEEKKQAEADKKKAEEGVETEKAESVNLSKDEVKD